MAGATRIARSQGSSASRRRRPSAEQGQERPRLRVISGGKAARSASSQAMKTYLRQMHPARGMVLVVCAVGFLSASLVASLLLRTQMIENSFEAASVQQSINELSQDVQDRQNTLDALDASLPQRAQRMGMVPQNGSVTIDMKGYKPSAYAKESR